MLNRFYMGQSFRLFNFAGVEETVTIFNCIKNFYLSMCYLSSLRKLTIKNKKMLHRIFSVTILFEPFNVSG